MPDNQHCAVNAGCKQFITAKHLRDVKRYPALPITSETDRAVDNAIRPHLLGDVCLRLHKRR